MSLKKMFSKSSPGKSQKTPDDAVMPQNNDEAMLESLVTIAAEVFRLQKTLTSVLSRLDPMDQTKYSGQFSWFLKKSGKALDEAGVRILNLEGQDYDPGMAVTPLNIEEFEPEDSLYIEQMIEPVVMYSGSVRKTGTVLLGKEEE